MGSYVYKVTSKRVKLTDGTEANVAVFAYKPYSFNDKENAKMAFRSGCGAAERFVKGANFTGKVVIAHIAENGTMTVSHVAKACRYGTFDSYDFEQMTTVGTPA